MTNYHVIYATYRQRDAQRVAGRYEHAELTYTPHSGWEVRVLA